MSFEKLVRDKIPEAIRQSGDIPIVRTLDEDEYKKELLKKLVEEARELLDSPQDINERADIAEILIAIDAAFGFDVEEIESRRQSKLEERGGFAERVYLEGIE